MTTVETARYHAAVRCSAPTAQAVSELIVVVPAHNEEQLIGTCLAALLDSQRVAHRLFPQLTCRIVVVLDDCEDDTGVIVQRMGIRSIVVDRHSVGAARRAGVRAALADAGAPLRRIWLASTDADCRVPAGWMSRFVDAAAHGYHLVLGMVHPSGDLPASRLHAWQDRHPYVEGHPHVHGAALGIRADVYHDIGGWRPLQTGEDVELVKRAEQRPWIRILRTAQDPVCTSARTVGRAPAGFADYMTNLPELSRDR
jgi:glycosyltransferase involved in cell wall biosynthesis